MGGDKEALGGAREQRSEISGADVKSAGRSGAMLAASSVGAFNLRGEAVMLAADVALIFGVETREIVQNITSNPDQFTEEYASKITLEELDALRSAGLASKPERGWQPVVALFARMGF